MDAASALANGRYRLVSVLGEGGQATVYRAWDARLGVWRAVKVLHPGGLRQLRDRFEAEARTLARLRHANLLVVHDVGEEGQRVYMVMDLAGESLEDRMRREGPLPPGAAARVGEAVAGALGVAHAAGVVHRDIKPANILSDDAGLPLLSDFGIAKVLDEQRTRTDAMLGTPPFMAPEQLAGVASADARVDIYALGATLYTAIVGHVPSGPIEDLSDTAVGPIPEPLRAVLRTATARQPGRRYRTAEDLRTALLATLTQLRTDPSEVAWRPPRIRVEPPPSTADATWIKEPVVGPTAVPAVEPPVAAIRRPRSRRLPVMLALAGLGVVGLGVVTVTVAAALGVAGWWWTARPPSEAVWVGEIRQVTSYPSGMVLELFGVSDDGTAVLYLDVATGLVWRHPIDGSTPRARLHPEIDEPRLAGYFDENLLAFLDPEGRLAVRDVRTDRVTPFDHQGSQFEISPRSDQIAWHDGRSAFRATVDGGPAVPIASVPEGQFIHGIAWSPDQETVALVVIGEQKMSDKQIRVILADTDGMMSSRPLYVSGIIDFTDRSAPIAWPWPEALVVAESTDPDEDHNHLVVVPIDGSPPIHLPPLPVKAGQLAVRGDTLAVLGLRSMRDTWIAPVEGGHLGPAVMPWADEDTDHPVAWLPDGALAFESDRFRTPRLLAQRPDSPDVRVLAEGDGVKVSGGDLVRLRDDGTIERAPIPRPPGAAGAGPDEAPWVPTAQTRWDVLSCVPDGTCASARNQGDVVEFSHFAAGATVGIPFSRMPVGNQVAIALSPDGRALAMIERAGSGVIWLWDIGGSAWREVAVPELYNIQGIGWRTDAPGWWVGTASSKYGSGPVMAAVRSDGTVEDQTPLQGWSSRPTPSADGKSLAFDVHRRDMDVWVTELPAAYPY